MNPVLWTKSFHFSASFVRDGRVYGHNFNLLVTLRHADGMDESAVEKTIEESLIQKIHSRDLSTHVDFLKNIPITDLNLLTAFDKIISSLISPLKLHSLALERDSRTRFTLEVRGV